MNRLMCVALSVTLLAVNPAAFADNGPRSGPAHGSAPGNHYSGKPGPRYSGHGNPGYGHSGHGNPRNYYAGHGGYVAHHPAYRYPAYKGWYGYGPRYVRGYAPYRPAYYPYRPYYGRGGYGYAGYPYYQHKNNNNHSDWPAYVAGGLIVGALLTNAYNKSHANDGYYAPQSAPVAPSAQGRRLLRDINGNCYERQTDSAGNELRTELPPSECNW